MARNVNGRSVLARAVVVLRRWLSPESEGSGGDGLATNEDFDADFYLQKNPDVAASGVDPYRHYIKYGRSEGRRGGAPVNDNTSTLECSEMYSERNDDNFDEDYYSSRYPDVVANGGDPYAHFVRYGKAEGRQGRAERMSYVGDFDLLDSNRETVLVVSHEASRTGAPVLSLNIARELKKRYNVITMNLRCGALDKDFHACSNVVIGPVAEAHSPLAVSYLIKELLSKTPLAFAIANSIETRSVLRALAENYIPSISLIHEFAAYTRPEWVFAYAALWSAHVVYSAPVIFEDAVYANPHLASTKSSIIPQGRCEPPGSISSSTSDADEGLRISSLVRPALAAKDVLVVIGAGFVQLRKGVDLFIDCAAHFLRRFPDIEARFVWIGNGYDPANDMQYSVYLADQVRRAGLEKHVFFVGETSNIQAAYNAADIMLISSRLDPLPNVAIDAMAVGLPLICFDRTTGIADILKSNDLGDSCVVPYLDTAQMALRIGSFAGSAQLRESVSTKTRQIVKAEFDMALYVRIVEKIARDANPGLDRERADVTELHELALPDRKYFFQGEDQSSSQFSASREYVRNWVSGIALKKPFPGFHPGVYSECSQLESTDGDPLVHYLRQGSPVGPWTNQVIVPALGESALETSPRVALHIHAYYVDLLADILNRLAVNVVRPDLYITVNSIAAGEQARQILAQYPEWLSRIELVPNRGRDIGPFLTAFGANHAHDYEIVGHVHTKKSVDIVDAGVGASWREFLLENLLGSHATMADAIVRQMQVDPSIGIVFPDDPNILGWNKNRPFAEQLAPRLGINCLPDHFLFPIGTMFWARVEALSPLFRLDLAWDDYPAEPIPYDGSLLHALERLIGVVASRAPFRPVTTSLPNVTR